MTSTIAISNELKENLRNLGKTGESYEDVIKRMYELTKKQMLMNFLYESKDSISIDQAIKEAKIKWQE